MQIMHFILDKILKLLTYYTPYCHQSLESYVISKQTVFFGPPCIQVVTQLQSTCYQNQLTIDYS